MKRAQPVPETEPVNHKTKTGGRHKFPFFFKLFVPANLLIGFTFGLIFKLY
jgi:hypothetical protein